MSTALLNHYEEIEKEYEELFKTDPFLNRKLVSFQANKDLPFYNWFAYREGFSYHMFQYFIEKFEKSNPKKCLSLKKDKKNFLIKNILKGNI
jgi:hypothetical protein